MNIYKATAVLGLLTLLGCSPIPHRYACQVPVFNLETIEVHKAFATWGVLAVSCPVAAPEHFTLKTTVATIQFLVLTGRDLWVRAESVSGAPLEVRGEHVRPMSDSPSAAALARRFTHDVNVELDKKVLYLNLLAEENVVERLILTFDVLRCTCASYDAV